MLSAIITPWSYYPNVGVTYSAAGGASNAYALTLYQRKYNINCSSSSALSSATLYITMPFLTATTLPSLYNGWSFEITLIKNTSGFPSSIIFQDSGLNVIIFNGGTGTAFVPNYPNTGSSNINSSSQIAAYFYAGNWYFGLL